MDPMLQRLGDVTIQRLEKPKENKVGPQNDGNPLEKEKKIEAPTIPPTIIHNEDIQGIKRNFDELPGPSMKKIKYDDFDRKPSDEQLSTHTYSDNDMTDYESESESESDGEVANLTPKPKLPEPEMHEHSNTNSEDESEEPAADFLESLVQEPFINEEDIKVEPKPDDDYDQDIKEKLKEMGEISFETVKKGDAKPKKPVIAENEVSVVPTKKTAEEEQGTAERKGNMRRNIREVMDETKLDESTLAAQRQEMERVRRVQEQQKLQRQMAQERVISLLQGNHSPKAGTSGARIGNTVLVKLPNGQTKPMTKLTKKPLELMRLPKGSISPTQKPRSLLNMKRPHQPPHTNLTPSVSIAPVGKRPMPLSRPASESDSDNEDMMLRKPLGRPKQKEMPVQTIDISSDDDCIVVSESENDPTTDEVEDPTNSGMHTNDEFNQPDEQGRVVINIGHPEDEPDLYLAPQIARIIKPHQIGGIRFLYDNLIESTSRFENSTGFGCILAHSMGLGKTLQVVTFSDIFLRHTPAKTILCIMPINTLQNWMAEYNMWLPTEEGAPASPLLCHGEVRPRNFNLHVLNDSHKTLAARAKVIHEWRTAGGVLLIGYEQYRLLSLRKYPKSRSKKPVSELNPNDEDKNKLLFDEVHEALVKPGPDLVICDEGHRIKNSHASISQALKQMKTKRRVVLTGYPLQNNLMEYWCMVDFVRPNYLGTKTEFCNMFERPIQNGQCIDSTETDIKLMRYRAHVLHSLLLGFVQRRSHRVLQTALPQKEEYVLLVRMTDFQRTLYETFMNEVVRTQTVPNPLKAFAVCCKIWNHPDVLYYFLKKQAKGDAVDIDLEEVSNSTGSSEGPTKNKSRAKRPPARGKNVKPAASVTPYNTISSEGTQNTPSLNVPPSQNPGNFQTQPPFNQSTNMQSPQSSNNFGNSNFSLNQNYNQTNFQPNFNNRQQGYMMNQSLNNNSNNYNNNSSFTETPSEHSNFSNNSNFGDTNQSFNQSQGFNNVQNSQFLNTNQTQTFGNTLPSMQNPKFGKNSPYTSFPNTPQNHPQSVGNNSQNLGNNSQSLGNSQSNFAPSPLQSSSFNSQNSSQSLISSQSNQSFNTPPNQPFRTNPQNFGANQTFGNTSNSANQNFPSNQQSYNYPNTNYWGANQDVKPQTDSYFNNFNQPYSQNMIFNQNSQWMKKEETSPVKSELCSPETKPKINIISDIKISNVYDSMGNISPEKKINILSDIKLEPKKEDLDYKDEFRQDYKPEIKNEIKQDIVKLDPHKNDLDDDVKIVGDGTVATIKTNPTPTKEDTGIPYDWAIELLKDYVPGFIENSAKMQILFCIIKESLALGDRLLVFSQSLITLDLIEQFLQMNVVPGETQHWAKNVTYYRLDGSTSALEREKLINEFNSNSKVYVFLVSTRAGSLGINLIGANRVVVLDASWNPCHDTQAVCRVYRYGQRKPCFVYRLVVDNCLEKKIYDRQINKQGMSDRVVDECNPDAHLTMKDVSTLCWDDEKECEEQDWSHVKDNYIDVVLQKVLEQHGKRFNKEPFQHESLLIDRKDKQLSQQEKRLAKKGYEREKQAARQPSYGISAGARGHRPVASVRPMQQGGDKPTRWIPAEHWQRQGMTAQEMTLPLDVVIPTNQPDKGNIVLKAGQKVLVLKSPKGVYMQLESGKIVAIKTAIKVRGKAEEDANKAKQTLPVAIKNNSALSVLPPKRAIKPFAPGMAKLNMRSVKQPVPNLISQIQKVNKKAHLAKTRPYQIGTEIAKGIRNEDSLAMSSSEEERSQDKRLGYPFSPFRPEGQVSLLKPHSARSESDEGEMPRSEEDSRGSSKEEMTQMHQSFKNLHSRLPVKSSSTSALQQLEKSTTAIISESKQPFQETLDSITSSYHEEKPEEPMVSQEPPPTQPIQIEDDSPVEAEEPYEPAITPQQQQPPPQTQPPQQQQQQQQQQPTPQIETPVKTDIPNPEYGYNNYYGYNHMQPYPPPPQGYPAYPPQPPPYDINMYPQQQQPYNYPVYPQGYPPQPQYPPPPQPYEYAPPPQPIYGGYPYPQQYPPPPPPPQGMYPPPGSTAPYTDYQYPATPAPTSQPYYPPQS